MSQKAIKKLIDVYREELRKELDVRAIILFGSQASGKATNGSDVDLIVLSDKFSKMNADKRFSVLARARKHPLTLEYPMDIFGLTPKEYLSANYYSVIAEAREKGKVVFGKI